jgi:hypothetical protein
MEISSVGADLVHVERRIYGRTNMTKLIGVFRDNANAPENPKKTTMFTKTAVKI